MDAVRSRPVFALLVAVALILGLAGCGASTSGDYGGEHPDYAHMLAGSPAPLAALHREAGKLLQGGQDAYEARIAELRGYPIVVNVWGSWCGPCRFEFPMLQQVSARQGKRVAFLGIDMDDSDSAAHTFLAEAPVPYPSYTDPDESLANSIAPRRGLPRTAFYDKHGSLVFLKLGPYKSASELSSDVRLYAVEGGGSG